MNIHNRTINLATQPKIRFVKWLALTTFSGVRTAAAALAQLPMIANHAAQDILEAWQESASSKS